MKHKLFDFRTAYIDLLLNVLTGIIFLFVLTTLMIQPKKNEDSLKKNAEFIINAEWNKDYDCDVDMWVRDPKGNTVYFEKKDSGIMHLERDDLGFRGDTITILGDKKISNNENKETWVLRGNLPGEYTVNLHLYSCRYGADQFPIGSEFKVDVKVDLYKINPSFKQVYSQTVSLMRVWDEVTVFNFVLNNEGNVTSIDNDNKKLVKTLGR